MNIKGVNQIQLLEDLLKSK